MIRTFLLSAFSLLVLGFSPVNGQIIIDHASPVLFAQIPDSVLPQAAALRMMLRHASIGGVLDQGLDCIQGTRTSPAECTLFPDYRYDRREWVFQNRGNPAWYDKILDFETQVDAQHDTFDVMAFKFCFIDYASTPCNAQQRFDSMRVHYEALESRYPSKTFVWWTVPLTQSFGIQCGEDWNSLIRAYARQNGKILFDIADIESHDTLGNFITDTAGLEMAWQPYCGEQQPGGPSCHPNWMGNLRICQALWVMMARIAGWDGTPSGIRGPSPSSFPDAFGTLPNPARSSKITPLVLQNGWRLYDVRGNRVNAGAGLENGMVFVKSRDGKNVRKILILN